MSFEHFSWPIDLCNQNPLVYLPSTLQMLKPIHRIQWIFLKRFLFYFYMKAELQNEETEKLIINYFIPQMTAIARAGQIQSWEPGTPSTSPTLVQRHKALSYPLLPYTIHRGLELNGTTWIRTGTTWCPRKRFTLPGYNATSCSKFLNMVQHRASKNTS